jgi:ABC-2 type transport system ATP-binding protein
LDEAERCSRLALLFKGRIMLCDTPEKLKRRMPGTVLVVSSPRARDIRERLTDAEGVSSVVLVGYGVHLVVDDAERRLPELRRSLETASIPFDAITPSEPTIEDLFVAYVQGQR